MDQCLLNALTSLSSLYILEIGDFDTSVYIKKYGIITLL